MNLKRALQADWDAFAGIIAAVVALMMHFLHVIEVDVLLSIALVLMALLFIRDLRRERDSEQLGAKVRGIEEGVSAIRASLHPPDAVLVGPVNLRKVSRRFSERAFGQMTWFHVCLSMFRTQELRHPPETGHRQSRRLGNLLHPGPQPEGSLAHRAPAQDPGVPWCEQGARAGLAGHQGERILHPLGWPGRRERRMPAQLLGRALHVIDGRSVPRYIFDVQPGSELVTRFAEMERGYRLAAERGADEVG